MEFRSAGDREDAVATLNGLIETCRDGVKGFRTSAEGVDEPAIQNFCANLSRQRAEFASELAREVEALGGRPARSGHAAGAVHRRWIAMKAAVTHRDEGVVLGECERGEDVAVRNYVQALDTPLPAGARAVVERQYSALRDAHAHLCELEAALQRKS